MKIKPVRELLLSTCVALNVGVLAPFSGNAADEGSHSKSNHEGSHTGHKHDGAGSAKKTEGSQTKQQREGSGTAGDMEAMMSKWKEYSTPGKHHEHLNILAGKWKHEVKHWMSPDAEPEITKGTSDSRWIMGGRFLQQSVTGFAMGQPFEGMGIIGYDKSEKEYTSIWIDNMGTGMMQGTGEFDARKKTLSESGSYSCPIRGGKSHFRSVTKLIDKDRYTFTMYGPDMVTGAEYKTMEITYSRDK